MMKFRQLICSGELCLEPITKKSVRQILSYIWLYILLVCKKSVLQIFILLCMNVKSAQFRIPEILRLGSYG